MTRPTDLLRRLAATAADPRRIAAGVAIAFGVTSAGLLAAPAPAFAWDPGSYSGASESQLISQQNGARASGGLRSLKLDTALRTIARWRSKDMVARDYFSHTIKGTSHNVFWYMQHEYGYCFKVAGENIGTVTWKGASVSDATDWVFNAFMNSAGHRANIMGKSWDVVAVGAYKGPGDKFMWTVLFADRCGGATPAPAPKPKPKPQPRPDPKPRAKPQPKPQAHATQKPKPKPERTPRPAAPTPSPSSVPPTIPSGGQLPVPAATPAASPVEVPVAALPPGQLRVVDAQPPGLVDTILDGVTAQFFGG